MTKFVLDPQARLFVASRRQPDETDLDVVRRLLIRGYFVTPERKSFGEETGRYFKREQRPGESDSDAIRRIDVIAYSGPHNGPAPRPRGWFTFRVRLAAMIAWTVFAPLILWLTGAPTFLIVLLAAHSVWGIGDVLFNHRHD